MSGTPFSRFLDASGFLVLDGGFATALEAVGYTLDSPQWSARAVLDAPELVREVHRSYLEAGADCVTTAGYQATFGGYAAMGLDRAGAEAAIRRAVSLAVEAKESFWADPAHRVSRREPIVAASAGPYGAFLADGSEYNGRYGVPRAVLERFHQARLDVLRDTEADVIAFETIPSALEADVLARLLQARTSVSAWISFSCRDSNTLWDGTPIAEAVRLLASVPALVGVGVNCTAPDHISGLIDKMGTTTDLPVIVYPNAGEGYDPSSHAWIGPGTDWLDYVGAWVGAGARVIGGCCRVGPTEIGQLKIRLEEMHAL